MNLDIREATNADFKGIFLLLNQLWPDLTLDYEKLKKVYLVALVSIKQHLIVAEVDGKIVGFCSLTIKNNLWQAGNLAHVDELVIDKDFRGNGLGKKLLESITKIAEENYCKRIELDSSFHRKEAHNFYESVGYKNRAFLFSKTLGD
ncbi:GNAT family N-acetyltransferase [Xanthovirga aplysinae]|uniref:GNAT family N-acetyltransferase n=1 Tax=Xanthovirga aplysinae TaxID=2529853 RepID=UPI0012BC9C27|nr:GNAT family N-acetyltransferase [Xanthovirga aplysinae]MTI30487.1 GNAT family N-acetyltransferase [Xanthovirga aplysinae]